jgi:hypothetical protein
MHLRLMHEYDNDLKRSISQRDDPGSQDASKLPLTRPFKDVSGDGPTLHFEDSSSSDGYLGIPSRSPHGENVYANRG